MPHRNEKPSVASTLATLAGCAMVAGSLLLTLHSATPPGDALAIGSVLGAPFIVWDCDFNRSRIRPKQPETFLARANRSKEFVLGFVAGVTFLTCFLARLPSLFQSATCCVGRSLGNRRHSTGVHRALHSWLVWVGSIRLQNHSTLVPRKAVGLQRSIAILRDKPPERTQDCESCRHQELATSRHRIGRLLRRFSSNRLQRPLAQHRWWAKANSHDRSITPMVSRKSQYDQIVLGPVGTAALAWYLYRIRRAVMIRAKRRADID